MAETNSALIKLTDAVRMLAAVRTAQDAQKLMGLAEAARVYAQQSKMGIEAQNYGAEIKLRAERLAGHILAQSEMSAGGRPPKTGMPPHTGSAPTLADMGISKAQSSRWQAINSIPQAQWRWSDV